MNIVLTGSKDNWTAKACGHVGHGHGPMAAVRDLLLKIRQAESQIEPPRKVGAKP